MPATATPPAPTSGVARLVLSVCQFTSLRVRLLDPGLFDEDPQVAHYRRVQTWPGSSSLWPFIRALVVAGRAKDRYRGERVATRVAWVALPRHVIEPILDRVYKDRGALFRLDRGTDLLFTVAGEGVATRVSLEFERGRSYARSSALITQAARLLTADALPGGYAQDMPL